MNEDSMDSKVANASTKLHSMLRELEEVNYGHNTSERSLRADQIESLHMAAVDTNLQNNNHFGENDYDKMTIEKQGLHLSSLLDEEIEVSTDEDIVIEEDDSWLLKTPTFEGKPERKPRVWLTDNVRTPELNRVKGSLASKVDLILIQTRKEKLNSLLAKHNLGSHTESAPGRLYQAESMCSVMSMDWEYDDDFVVGNHARSMGAFSNSPIRRRENGTWHSDNNQFDDLQPMTLDFDSSPTGHRSFQALQGPVAKSRSTVGRTTQVRRQSFSDRSDSSGDFPSSPRSSLGSSRNSLDSGEGTGIRRGKLSGDHNVSSTAHKPASSSVQVDPSLTVKLPKTSPDGPVLRRRGGNAKKGPIAMSTDAVPSIRSNNKGVAARGKDQAGSPTQSRLQMPRPRTSQPLPRKSLLPSQKRFPQNSELNQSPDIVPRKESSPERRSLSPDLISRKSGIIRRGQATSRSYQI